MCMRDDSVEDGKFHGFYEIVNPPIILHWLHLHWFVCNFVDKVMCFVLFSIF